jgi:hypothetical protein
MTVNLWSSSGVFRAREIRYNKSYGVALTGIFSLLMIVVVPFGHTHVTVL